MARFVDIIFYTLMFLSFFVDADGEQSSTTKSTTSRPVLQCKDSETQDDCPVDCPSDYCPKNRYVNQSHCTRPATCPPPKCKCRFNYRRACNGTCIPTRDCHKSSEFICTDKIIKAPFPCDGPHESYNYCPPVCPGENCTQATADGKCHLPGHLPVLNCKPACRCDEKYWRLNGTCVPYDECPK